MNTRRIWAAVLAELVQGKYRGHSCPRFGKAGDGQDAHPTKTGEVP